MPSEFLFSHGEIDIHKTTVGGNPVVIAKRGGCIVGTCAPPRGGHDDCVFGIPTRVMGADAGKIRRALEAGVVFIKF